MLNGIIGEEADLNDTDTPTQERERERERGTKRKSRLVHDGNIIHHTGWYCYEVSLIYISLYPRHSSSTNPAPWSCASSDRLRGSTTRRLHFLFEMLPTLLVKMSLITWIAFVVTINSINFSVARLHRNVYGRNTQRNWIQWLYFCVHLWCTVLTLKQMEKIIFVLFVSYNIFLGISWVVDTIVWCECS